MPASPASTAPATSWSDRARVAWLALAGVALTVYFHTPVREVMNTSLDSSNYASYAYFTARGFQYGPEIVPMAGPYGFVLYGWVYSGELFWARTFAEIALNASLAGLTLWFLLGRRGAWWRWVWLAAHLAFTPFIEDLFIEWILLLAGLFLLQTAPGGRPARWVAPVSALLAFLCLVKGTQLILGLATLAVVLAGHAWLRRWRHVALIGGAYLSALVGFWLLAGQNLLHLPAYVQGIMELARGYNDAMSLEEPLRVLIRGALVSAGLLAGLGWALWHHRRSAITVACLLLLAGHSFVQWKHGFVRADGHAYIYFHYAIVAALAIGLVAADPAAGRPGRLGMAVLSLWLGAVLVTASHGRDESMLPGWRNAPRVAWARLRANARYLSALPEVRAAFEARLAGQRRLHESPLVRRIVGASSIDLFGFEHARLTLNGLNYRPRPMGGGTFNAYTPKLMQLNRDFIRDPVRRPEYYLTRMESIDWRLVSLNDGLVLLDLLSLYRPVLMEQNHLLMQAAPDAVPPEPRLLSRQVFRIRDWVTLPPVEPGQMLLARFDLHLNLLGRLRAAVYKVPQLGITLLGDGLTTPSAHRLIPVMAASPFLLSPLVEDMHDFVELYTAQSTKHPRSFRISTSDATWFVRSVTAEFYTVPRPQPSAEAGSLLAFASSNIEGVHTVDAVSGLPVELSAQLVHSPSRLSWKLDGTERSVAFGFGLVPGAYTAPNETDGVGFTVRLLLPGAPPRILFQRLLDPRNQPGDRGHQHASLALPAFPAGSRLEVATDGGPADNLNCDWAYISNLSLLPAPAGQDPGSDK